MSDETDETGTRDAGGTVAGRVADRCLALSTAAPDGGLAPLAPLRETLADRTVVGLGEATHGSREFFDLKHRLIRLLVRECNCRVVAMEADFSAARALEDYVIHGEGDPREAIAGLQVWPWKVESVLALVEWLRSFNEDRPPGDRVRFYGVDAQHTDRAARALRDYLGRVDPEFLAGVEDDLDTLAEGLRYWATETEELISGVERTTDTVAAVEDRLADRRGAYVEATSPAEHEVAVGHARTLRRAHDLAGALARGEDGAWAVRERSMARGVEWALDREDADRAVVWAHDTHLKRTDRTVDGATFPGLGGLLADRYGEDYYALGFDFDRGSVRAYAGPEIDGEGLGEYGVDPLREPADDAAGTVTDAFGAVDAPAAVLDFDRAREDDRLAEWLDTPRERRDVGAVYREGRQTTVEPPGEAFDGLAFVRETTAARPLEASSD